MADEEIEVKIKQTSEGNAIEQTKAKIQELYKTAAAYESKGGMETAAKSARQEARSLENDLTRLAKERTADERAVLRERTKVAAEEKLTTRKSTRIAGAVANFAEGQIGAGGFSGITSALGSVGGPMGAIAAAVAAVTVGIAAAFSKEKDRKEIAGLEDKRERTMQDRRLRRMAGFEGSSSSAREAEEGFRDKFIETNANRPILKKKSEFKWYNPAGWIDQMTGASEADAEKNERENRLARDGMWEAREIKKKKFAEVGRVELRSMEAASKGLRKDARDLDRQREWTEAYNHALGNGADEMGQGEATRIANAKMHEKMIAQGRAIGGKLGSNAGAAEIARVARIAENPNVEVKESISQLTAFLRGQHDEVSRQAWRRQFTRTLDFSR